MIRIAKSLVTVACLFVLPLLGVGCSAGAGSAPPIAVPLATALGVAPVRDSFIGGSTEVYFATTRKPQRENTWFGSGDSGILHFGIANVSFAQNGDLLAQARKAVDTNRNMPRGLKGKLESIHSISKVENGTLSPTFADHLAHRLGPGGGDVVIYVHGYKVDFATPVTRAAQLQQSLGKDTVGVAFCWHSGTAYTGYLADLGRAKESADRLADVIQLLAAQPTVRRVSLVCYSAGAPLVSSALETYASRIPTGPTEQRRQQAKLGAILFLSADVDLDAFGKSAVHQYYPLCERITVTLSSRDGPLQLASVLGGGARLGADWQTRLSMKDLADMAAADRIDFLDLGFTGPRSARGIDFTGHHVWFANGWLMSDLVLTLTSFRPPAERGLDRKPDGAIWYFPADYPQRLRSLRQTVSTQQ